MDFYKVNVKTDKGIQSHVVRSKNKRNAITNVLTNIIKVETVNEVSCQKVIPQFEPTSDESK